MKKYFILNNKHDSSEGYTEVTQYFISEYVKACGENKPHFINLGYAIMETDEEGYYSFYHEKNRYENVDKASRRAGLMSLNAIDSDELDGVGMVVDTSEPFEEKVLRKLMTDKLPEALKILSDDEREIIQKLYFEHISERVLAADYGVARMTLCYRRDKVLKKLKNFFEKS